MIGFLIGAAVIASVVVIAAIPSSVFIVKTAKQAHNSQFFPMPYGTRVVGRSPMSMENLAKVADKFCAEWALAFGTSEPALLKLITNVTIEFVDGRHHDLFGNPVNGELTNDGYMKVSLLESKERIAVEVVPHEWIHAANKLFRGSYGEHPEGPWTDPILNEIESAVVKYSRTLPLTAPSAESE